MLVGCPWKHIEDMDFINFAAALYWDYDKGNLPFSLGFMEHPHWYVELMRYMRSRHRAEESEKHDRDSEKLKTSH